MIAPEIERLLEPLERFEAIRRRAARLGDRLADLSFANAWDGPPERVRDALRATLDDVRTLDLQYTPFGGAPLGRRTVADALARSHGLPFAFGDVVLTPGAMAALQLALRVSAHDGGEVLIPTPCWIDHPLYARALGLRPRLLPPRGPRLELDLDALRDAITPRTCAVLLSHPGNPTGRTVDARTLDALGALLHEAERAHDRRIALIADETHRDFVDGAYRSAAASYARTILVYSFGKYHFAQGQRLGYAAVSPRHPERDAVAAELVRWTRVTGIATPTALMQRAIPRLLALRHDLAPLADARARALERLADAGFAALEPDATAFVYVRTPPGWSDDFAFTEALARRGALVLPAPVFHHAGWVRLALTATAPMRERALTAMGELAADVTDPVGSG